MLVSKSVSANDIVRVIKTSGKGLVKEARIFDVYEGSGIDDELKSVAVNIVIGKEETLTDKEITDLLDKIKYELAKSLGATIRM